jgi:predicted transcriptional regulator
MNIQFVRLDHDVCETINQIALESRRTVSDLVNDMVRQCLRKEACQAAEARSPLADSEGPAL